MSTEPNFWKFGVTLATVCIPFFLLIGFLNTDSGYRLWMEKTKLIWRWIRPKKKTETNDDAEFEPAPVSRSLSSEEGMKARMGANATARRPQHDTRPSHPNIKRIVEAMGEGKESGLTRMGTVQFEGIASISDTSKEKEDGQASTNDTVIDVRDS